jgi:serine/threonine-protein kinase
VKPENVLIDLSASSSSPSGGDRGAEQPKVKLTDFGIAKLLDAQGVTSTGQVLGSPAHMAPEQIEGGDVGPRADVFALGVMLYETMVGRLPFDGKNPAQVLRRVLDGTYPPADREQPIVGARWASVLAKALARDAADRYESIEAFVAAITEELTRVGISEPRREVDRFLLDQAAYAESVEGTTVQALVESGELARAAGDYPLAVAQFNRALAYRPGDAELVRRVSRIARRKKFVVGSRVAAGAAAVLGLVVFVAWRVQRPLPPGKALVKQINKESPAGAAPSAGVRSVPVPAPFTSPKDSPAPVVRRKPFVPREAPRPPAEIPTRAVVVDITGAKGGKVKIDGVLKDEWFGVQHRLPVGPHTFEVVLADADCCRPPPPLTRVIEEGDTVLPVTLAVSFRDAKLRVDRSPPGLLQCRSLFSADLPVPGNRSVPMSTLTAGGLCTMISSDTAQPSTTKEVTLAAGQTTEISWP